MINTYHGIAINFGIASGITTAVGVFQTNDHGVISDNEIIRDGTGAEIEKTFYAFKQTATFEYVASQAGAPVGNSTVTYPLVGAMVTITDSIYPNIADTHWLVDDIAIRRSNVTAVRVTLKLTNYPSITV